jgi:hypothetical protein
VEAIIRASTLRSHCHRQRSKDSNPDEMRVIAARLTANKDSDTRWRATVIGLIAIAWLCCACWARPLRHSQGEPAQSESRSVWDGVYSEDQAKRGEQLFQKGCASCHGETLHGAGEAPPLAGARFTSNWNGLPLGDLFERIRRTMPQDNPGRIGRQNKIDILAYILSFNKFPAGNTDLPRQPEFLRDIRFEASKPESTK